MEDDPLNDMKAVEILDNESEPEKERRPIMLLLKCLIRNKQNTVMTNNQIMEILKQEFNISIDACHELEIDIYIKIIKKYLKDWPQWEELERISSKLSSTNDNDAVNQVLNNKYRNLKEYLGVRLDIAKPLAKQAVPEGVGLTPDDSRDVVMEIYCTREQLNHLIYRKPRSDLNNTIFNINKIEPTRISLNTFSFESILNFWATKINVTLPNFIYTREIDYKFEHKLINKVREDKTPVETMDTRLCYKNKNTKPFTKSKTSIYTYFYKIMNLYEKDTLLHRILQAIFNIMKADMKECADVKLGPVYRQFANKYKYVRYLCVDNNENTDPSYDLQMEELMAPSYQFCVSKMWKPSDINKTSVIDWLKIECTMCKIKFHGCPELIDQLQTHFNEHHQFEPAWQCTNCKQTFNIQYLSTNRWQHQC